MPITLHEAFVLTCRQTLGAVEELLGKTEAFAREHGIAEGELLAARLHETMLPFAYQVKSVADHSWGAIEGVRAGVFSPHMEAPPTDFDGLRQKLRTADDGLQALDPQELEAMIGRPMMFRLRDMELPFRAETFLLSFSLPNFFFHATTAYDILRMKGVMLGKRDFLGQLRLGA